MSTIPLVETAKNIIEVLNEIYTVSRSNFQWITLLKFLGKISFDWLFYFLSFQWINDFIKIPIIVPQMAESIFSEIPISQSYLSFFPVELSKNSLGTSFIHGFFNCFFFYLPFSSVHFIWLKYIIFDSRRFPWAGRAATLGLIIGNLSFFGCCLFGCQLIINIWFGLEPLSYFFSVWIVLTAIFDIVHSPYFTKIRYNKRLLWKIALIQIGCVWGDQSGFYQFLGNLSLQSGFSSLDFVDSSLIFYFIGIVLGSFCWTFLISEFFVKAYYFYLKVIKYSASLLVQGLYFFFLSISAGLTVTSFLFYGTNYLFANSMGFSPQDQALEIISISAQTRDTSEGRLGEKSNYKSIDTDLSTFDRGRYSGGTSIEFQIEALNYHQEYAWRSRVDRFSSRGLSRDGKGMFDDYLTNQLGPIDQAFQRQRKYKKRVRQIQILREKKAEKQKKEEIEKLEQKKREMKKIYSTSKYNFKNLLDEKPLKNLKSNKEFIQHYEGLIERYIENYLAEANPEDSEIPILPNEKRIRFSAFSELNKYAFDIFSVLEEAESEAFDEELNRDIKEKFSENFFNKFLLRFDILSYLKRQPKFHQLSSKDEISLFEKRLALTEYFDTLRSYFKLSNTFKLLFRGPKSYANHIYNQQFKGTFKVVERLFSIHLENKENLPPISKLQKKRNPNFPSQVTPANVKNIEKKLPKENFIVPKLIEPKRSQIRQQIKIEIKEDPVKESYSELLARFENEYLKLKDEQKDSSILKFDQPLYKTKYLKQNPLIHEQFIDQMSSLINEADIQPFLKEENPYPFFVGWDNEQRKFVVTNRLLTRENMLSEISLPKNIDYRNFSSTKKFFKQKTTPTFTFTSWPVTEQTLQNSQSFKRLFNTHQEMINSADDLFKYSEPGMEEDNIIYEKLPHIVQRIGFELKDQPYLAPKNGGLTWPGNEPLKYNYQSRLNDLKVFIQSFTRLFHKKKF